MGHFLSAYRLNTEKRRLCRTLCISHSGGNVRTEAFEYLRKGSSDSSHSDDKYFFTAESHGHFLKGYLPAQLSEAEVAEVVKATVAELGATSKKDMGRVMKEVMARVKGQADGKLVSKLVGAALP